MDDEENYSKNVKEYFEQQEKKNEILDKDLLKTNGNVKKEGNKINSMDDFKNLEKDNANLSEEITKNPKN